MTSAPAAAPSQPPVAFPLVARQPIFDRELDVFAYELLYRADAGSHNAVVHDPVRATATVVLGAFVDIGLERITGGAPAFLNIPEPYLIGEHPMPDVGDQLIIEVVQDVEPSREVMERLSALRELGHRISIDNFELGVGRDRFLPLADFVKVDILQHDESSLRRHVTEIQARDCKAIAEKVETQEHFDQCLALGFDYLQGFFFQRPRSVVGRRPSPTCVGLIKVLGEVYSEGGDIAALSRIVSHDVAMSYRLLKCLNSAAFSLSRRVESVPQAAALLGEKRMRQWITLMVVTGVAKRPHELILSSIFRASLCELLGLQCGLEDPGLFTSGLLSVLDAILDQPMTEVLEALPLAPDVEQAILSREGPLGGVFDATLSCERANFRPAYSLGLTPEEVGTCLSSATAFADEFRGHLGGSK